MSINNPRNNNPRNNKSPPNKKRSTTTKGRVTLYLEWSLEPSWKNRIEMEKILALTCHKLGEENLLSWSDVEVKSYNYKIDLNLRHKKPQTKRNKNDHK